MILVTARLAARPDAREELVRLLLEVRDASRAEEGCVSYGFFAAVDDPAAIIAVEEWRDREALQTHFATPHLVRMMREAPALLAGTPDIVAHEVAGSERLGA